MKDRPYATAEQYERWFMHDCARCGRHRHRAVRWPDGILCRTCMDKALRVRGRCPGCGAERLLPGRRAADGAAVCRDCAGITQSFFCNRCGTEGRLHTGRLCARCTLTDKVTAVLNDGTGQINPALKPLADMLTAMPNPWTGCMWLRQQHVQGLLTGLATGQIALTHEALHDLPNWRTVAYTRDLLMACGALPTIDKQLLHHETWLHHRLAELDGHPHQRLLRQFGLWHQLPKLRSRAQTRPLTISARTTAAQQFARAREFLAWLDDRGHALAQTPQADLDVWHATHLDHQKRSLRAFLTWAINTGRMPRLSLPTLQVNRAAPVTQRRRLDLLRRLLADETGPLHARVAASLMLLYAQPASRIAQLTVDDIIRTDDGQVLLRLGDPPSPIPAPFAALVLQAADHRANMTTAANPTARWLFPGRRAGQPLNSRTLADHIRDLGIPGQAVRVAALRQLVLQAPAPVIAHALGFHDKTTTRVATEAGSTWSRYATDDHPP